MPHTNGIVIHPAARLGPNCLVFQQVTIGTRANATGAPVIGGHVDIGAGAKILGPVQIGDHSVIGANAVVTRDVPAHAIAVGIPARIKQQILSHGTRSGGHTAPASSPEQSVTTLPFNPVADPAEQGEER